MAIYNKSGYMMKLNPTEEVVCITLDEGWVLFAITPYELTASRVILAYHFTLTIRGPN